MCSSKERHPATAPKGNDKPGGGSQKARTQQGRKIPGDTNNDLPEDMPAPDKNTK